MANTWVDPRAWTTSETLTAAKMNEISAALDAIGDPPASYTPVTGAAWTSNHTITGTNQEIGKWTFFTITVNFSGLPAGSGPVAITLPSTPSTDFSGFSAPFGPAISRDASATATHVGVTTYAGGTNVTAWFGSTRMANNSPHTYASGDYVILKGSYYRD